MLVQVLLETKNFSRFKKIFFIYIQPNIRYPAKLFAGYPVKSVSSTILDDVDDHDHDVVETRDDEKCGAGFPGPSGEPAGCAGSKPCCAPDNTCQEQIMTFLQLYLDSATLGQLFTESFNLYLD